MYVVFFLLSLLLLRTGVIKKSAVWMILSGILFGIALASAIVDESGLFRDGDINPRRAITLLAIGIGLFTITMLTGLFTDDSHYWPLVPGCVFVMGGVILICDCVTILLSN
ncbi:MAG TPA: hypothetical protein VFI27_19105 [candidate division Zixibacteria bacterium]|nr:hypothetical protein [candidate division Zixibacteria bacterium]